MTAIVAVFMVAEIFNYDMILASTPVNADSLGNPSPLCTNQTKSKQDLFTSIFDLGSLVSSFF